MTKLSSHNAMPPNVYLSTVVKLYLCYKRHFACSKNISVSKHMLLIHITSGTSINHKHGGMTNLLRYNWNTLTQRVSDVSQWNLCPSTSCAVHRAGLHSCATYSSQPLNQVNSASEPWRSMQIMIYLRAADWSLFSCPKEENNPTVVFPTLLTSQ